MKQVRSLLLDALKLLLNLYRTGQIWVGVTSSCEQVFEIRFFAEGGIREKRGMSQRVAHTTSGGSLEQYPLSVQH